MQRLNILHCLRAPVGGLFRHVCDLAEEQARLGHRVGVICDSTTGGTMGEARLSALARGLELGLHRMPMSREIGPRDVSAYRACFVIAAQAKAHVLHGHGAKGGAYGRLAARTLGRQGRRIVALYTPHGGSLHYRRNTVKGAVFLGLERHLEPLTDGLIFESAYSRHAYEAKIGKPRCAARVIHNGLRREEFGEHAPAADAAEFVFVGELRKLKGVDVLIEAMARLVRTRRCHCVVVGDGPDADLLRKQTVELGLADAVEFVGPLPAAEAFRRGRCLVVPSRAESFPYIVLEAAAARLPMIATAVGGIPEIFDGTGIGLVARGDVEALAGRMREMMAHPAAAQADAARLQRSVGERFTVAGMTRAILDFYRDCLAPEVVEPARNGTTVASPQR